MDITTRGNTIGFRIQFKNSDNLVVEPAEVILFISFPDSSGARISTEINMVNNSSMWEAFWDSGIARPGQIFWSIHTRSTSPAASVDGEFTLKANKANPENDN